MKAVLEGCGLDTFDKLYARKTSKSLFFEQIYPEKFEEALKAFSKEVSDPFSVIDIRVDPKNSNEKPSLSIAAVSNVVVVHKETIQQKSQARKVRLSLKSVEKLFDDDGVPQLSNMYYYLNFPP